MRAIAIRCGVLALPLCVLWCGRAYAGETDQFLVWGVELEDCSGALNRYLNTEAEMFLEKINRSRRKSYDAEELARKLYRHFFRGIHASRLRNWLQHSSDVERYPDPSVSYFQYYKMSIHGVPSFPYILPMSRTIRIGEVYCGIDKLSHFFGFGRRHYEDYLRLRAKGYAEEQAMEKIVLAGVVWENTLVGKLVDGIFSHADAEAAFQGFLMARALCGGESPRIERRGDKWLLVRPIDIRPYVSPDFDETYNPSHYWALRKRFVLARLKRRYGDQIQSPAVQERFARYALRAPSFSKRTIDAYFEKKGRHPQQKQFLETFGVPPGRASSDLLSFHEKRK